MQTNLKGHKKVIISCKIYFAIFCWFWGEIWPRRLHIQADIFNMSHKSRSCATGLNCPWTLSVSCGLNSRKKVNATLWHKRFVALLLSITVTRLQRLCCNRGVSLSVSALWCLFGAGVTVKQHTVPRSIFNGLFLGRLRENAASH